jgi:hypothetical protein
MIRAQQSVTFGSKTRKSEAQIPDPLFTAVLVREPPVIRVQRRLPIQVDPIRSIRR